ncbi:MAG: hybrid sensor histidine kinase/response regulator [Verrucomicrobia bacterium]|nr:hybrid sensor histidine kinase/response regulator [Verrucomicrobiota bacterium]
MAKKKITPLKQRGRKKPEAATALPALRSELKRVRQELRRAIDELRESEERHRLILDGIKDHAIFRVDPTGRIATWTQTAERIFGYSSAEAIGQPLSLISIPEDRPPSTLADLLKRAQQMGAIREDGWRLRKDGTRVWASGMLASLPGHAGESKGFVKVLRDDTDHRAAEESLREAKTAAESANLAKDHFLATISHELRTPLTATLLWAKLLNGPETLEPDQIREGLQAIEQSAQEQQALIEQLVDTSRIVTGKLRLQLAEVALVPLAHAVVEMIKPIATEKGLTVSESLDARIGTVVADALRLQQVFTNLLNNAVKFTPSGGKINFAMTRVGDLVDIKVTDSGKGISAEFLPKMFERFVQADPSTSAKGGLGLGLSIVKQLVSLHGGSVSVSSPGLAKGSTFAVRLPLPKTTPSANASEVARPPSLHGITVLLVEDDHETRQALTATMAAAGASVTAVDSAPRALKDFNRRRPDVILSDIGLGKVSGHDLLGQIRQWEIAQGKSRVPAVALTAYTDEKNRTQALQSGFQLVLSKPVDPVVLLRAIVALRDSEKKA